MADFEFEAPLDKDLECPICMDVQEEAYLTNCCGRHFCLGCINRVLNGRKPCPTCNCEKFQIFPNKERQRKIKDLRVCCQKLLTAEGATSSTRCTWRGELRDLERHEHRGQDEERRDPEPSSSSSHSSSHSQTSSLNYADEIALLKEILKEKSATGSSSGDEIVGDISQLTLTPSAGSSSPFQPSPNTQHRKISASKMPDSPLPIPSSSHSLDKPDTCQPSSPPPPPHHSPHSHPPAPFPPCPPFWPHPPPPHHPPYPHPPPPHYPPHPYPPPPHHPPHPHPFPPHHHPHHPPPPHHPPHPHPPPPHHPPHPHPPPPHHPPHPHHHHRPPHRHPHHFRHCRPRHHYDVKHSLRPKLMHEYYYNVT